MCYKGTIQMSDISPVASRDCEEHSVENKNTKDQFHECSTIIMEGKDYNSVNAREFLKILVSTNGVRPCDCDICEKAHESYRHFIFFQMLTGPSGLLRST